MRLVDTKNVSGGGSANSGTAMAVPAVPAATAMYGYCKKRPKLPQFTINNIKSQHIKGENAYMNITK